MIDGKPAPKQVEANHPNAQRLTGPRTPRGKQWVRLNALDATACAPTFFVSQWPRM